MSIIMLSFDNPNPEEGGDKRDWLDTNGIEEMLKFNSSLIQEFNSETNHTIEYSMVAEDIDENNANIFLVGSCESIDANDFRVQLDTQTIADELGKCSYSDTPIPDRIELIIETKKQIENYFSVKLLEKGSLSINSNYSGFGFVYSNGNKIASIESLKIASKDKIEYSDIVSLIDIEKVKDIFLKFYIDKKYCFNIQVSDPKDSTFSIKENGIEMVEETTPAEILALKAKNEISEEDFIESRKVLLDSDSLVEDVTEIGDFDF